MFKKKNFQINAKHSQSDYLSSNRLNGQIVQFFFTVWTITSLPPGKIRFIDKHTQIKHTHRHRHEYINGYRDKWPTIVERAFGEAVFQNYN